MNNFTIGCDRKVDRNITVLMEGITKKIYQICRYGVGCCSKTKETMLETYALRTMGLHGLPS